MLTLGLAFSCASLTGIGVGSLRSIWTRYVMSVVGLLSWPMGWGLVNVGTEAILISAVNTVKPAQAADWEITTYLWDIATVSIIPFWMIFGYAFVPFVIQRMVTSGANADSGLIGQTAGAAIGAIASGGASLAAGAAADAGGGGSASSGGASFLRGLVQEVVEAVAERQARLDQGRAAVVVARVAADQQVELRVEGNPRQVVPGMEAIPWRHPLELSRRQPWPKVRLPNSPRS